MQYRFILKKIVQGDFLLPFVVMAGTEDTLTTSVEPSRCVSPAPFKPVPSTRRVTPALIEPLLSRPERIRNVCILAHVDHGKTTLTDSLLASNGIISFKQAGTLRYMDAREDEQERGITMESSAVSLLFDHRIGVPGNMENASRASVLSDAASSVSSMAMSMEGLTIGDRRFLINLIDSPGHVDFSSQVMTAAKLCDGCLVLVDAVEGVCTQTAAVLRQAHLDHLKPCLVINKMDRLVTELKLSSSEASSWLIKLLAQVNAIQATIVGYSVEDKPEGTADDVEASEDGEFFSPSRGNVIFASATDGWAFRVGHFAALFSKKMDMNEAVLQKTLWGHYYFDPKSKRVVGQKGAEKLGLEKTMFAKFILDNIWTIYEATAKDTWDQGKLEKIAGGIGVRLPTRELKTRDGKTVLRSILTTWLPLAECAFGAIVDQLPTPIDAARERIPFLLHLHEETDETSSYTPELTTSLIETICSSHTANPSSSPTVAYLSKQFAVSLPSSTTTNADDEENHVEEEEEKTIDEKLIGMARLFHGSLSVGQKVYVLRPKYNPSAPDTHHYFEVTIEELYLLMGRDLEPVDKVYAGNVFGIGGLEKIVGKSATISDTLDCPSFDYASLPQKTVPIVRVALHPSQLKNMAQLETGLKLLCQADPCAESYLQEETGEYILATAGELHLEACLKDLRERFTKIEIEVSPPMVPFRETITEGKAINDSFWSEGLNQEKGEGATNDGILTLSSPNGILKLSVRAVPLREELVQFLGRNRVALRNSILEHDHGSSPILEKACIELNKAKLPVNHAISGRNIFGFGPRREGTCLLLATDMFLESLSWASDMKNSLISGFMMAVDQGPLCAEPMMGVGFILENIFVDESLMPTDATERCVMMTQLKGQLISITKDTCHRSFMFRSPRLMLAYYSCDIQTTAEVLGRVYSVVSRRMGQILSEEYNEGTGFFTIRSLIPVPESFGFADDIRGKTSGLAIPQLLFSGFRVFDQDPFWVPFTEEELEEFGEVAEKANVALRYLIGVRERKGLFVEKKIVQSAEKQRTLKK